MLSADQRALLSECKEFMESVHAGEWGGRPEWRDVLTQRRIASETPRPRIDEGRFRVLHSRDFNRRASAAPERQRPANPQPPPPISAERGRYHQPWLQPPGGIHATSRPCQDPLPPEPRRRIREGRDPRSGRGGSSAQGERAAPYPRDFASLRRWF